MAGGGGGTDEINLVPYLDIMINLIMFMLVVTAYIVELREAPVLVPTAVSGPSAGAQNPDQKGTLDVVISARGYSVLTSNGTPASEVLRVGTALDYKKLTVIMRQYKELGTLLDTVKVSAAADIPYREVVGTMDALRSDDKGPLYPGIQFGVAPPQ